MGHGNETTALTYPEACYHDPYDVDRLIAAARRALYAQVGETHPRECYRAFVELSAALDAFPEEPEALSPTLALRCTCNAKVAYRDDDCPLHVSAEPVPPGGGRWATEAEFRAWREATTLTPAEWARYAACRRKGVLH